MSFDSIGLSSIELFDEDNGQMRLPAQVAFTRPGLGKEYKLRKGIHDEIFEQLRNFFKGDECNYGIRVVSTKRINFIAGQRFTISATEGVDSTCFFAAAKCLILNEETGISKESVVELSKTIGEKQLENAANEVIWEMYQEIKARPSTAAATDPRIVTPMGYTPLKDPDDDHSCCTIM